MAITLNGTTGIITPDLTSADDITANGSTVLTAATSPAALPLAGGTLTGNVNFGDNVKAIFGAGSDLEIYHDASNSYIKDTAAGVLHIMGSSNVQIEGANGENMAVFTEDGAVALFYNNAQKIATTATGVSVTGTLAATAVTGDGSGLTGLGGGFPSGTVMLFRQSAAPSGWTKLTSDDNAALRIVSGTVGSGGSSGLSTALATPSVTGSISGSTGSTTLSTSQMPSHSHNYYAYSYGDGSNQNLPYIPSNNTYRGTYSILSTGGSGSHNHSLSASFSGGTASINVKYVDAIMASKD